MLKSMGRIMDKEKIKREKAWYKEKPRTEGGWSRLFHHPLFFSCSRIRYNYIFPKIQMQGLVKRHRTKRVEKLLIIPCGTGNDYPYLQRFSSSVYGLDISPLALAQCPQGIRISLGDIQRLPFQSETFDLIAVPLFFHHIRPKDFPPLLGELHRILKPNGGLILLEPSLWYPLNLIARPIKRIFNNPYGEVEDEDPFSPLRMMAALRATGFSELDLQAATYSHCAFYMPMAKVVNQITRGLLRVWPLKYFGWLVLFWGVKTLPSKLAPVTGKPLSQ
jgi:SAM-dependent methyltransferase